MPAMISNEGKAEILNRIFNEVDNVIIHLFINDITLAPTDTISSFTEMTASGYESVSLSNEWSVSINIANYTEVSFDLTEAATAYGFYITNEAETILLWSEKFDTAQTVGAGGGSILVTPEISIG